MAWLLCRRFFAVLCAMAMLAIFEGTKVKEEGLKKEGRRLEEIPKEELFENYPVGLPYIPSEGFYMPGPFVEPNLDSGFFSKSPKTGIDPGIIYVPKVKKHFKNEDGELILNHHEEEDDLIKEVFRKNGIQ